MKHLSVILVFIFISLLLASCREEAGFGTLRITIQTESKSILPSADAGRIIKYTVSGKGPGNKTFSQNSNSRTVTIEGIPNGTWELEAYGLSDTGKIVASGNKKITFSGSNSSEIIQIIKKSGEGSLSLKVDWDSDTVKPQLQFYIDNLSTAKTTQYSANIGNNESEYTQTFNNLESGYYLIRTILYDDGIKRAGSCEAFSIVSDYVTNGELTLKNSVKDGQEETKLSLLKSTSDYLNSTLGNLNSTLIDGKKYSPTLSLSNSMSTNDNITLAWYVDGVQMSPYEKLLSNVTEYNFAAEKGSHIINAVLYNSTARTCASARLRYTGFSDSPGGTAGFSASIDSSNNQRIKLDSSTRIGVLKNGKFLILTPAQNTLQLCHVSGSSLVLEKDGTYSSTMEKFTFISDATMLYSNTSSDYFIIVENNTNVHLMYYNSKKNSIEPAISVEDDSIVQFNGFFRSGFSDFTDIDRASIIANSDGTSTLLFTDSFSNEIYSNQCTDRGVKTKDISFKPKNSVACKAFAAYNNSIVYCDGENLHQAEFDGRSVSSVWKASAVSDLNNPFEILFINKSNLLIACSDRIKRLQFTSEMGSFKKLDDVNIPVCDICLTPDSSYMYACNSLGNLYSYATDFEGVFKQLDVYSASVSFKQVVANSENILAITDNGTLYLFDIVQEEI